MPRGSRPQPGQLVLFSEVAAPPLSEPHGTVTPPFDELAVPPFVGSGERQEDTPIALSSIAPAIVPRSAVDAQVYRRTGESVDNVAPSVMLVPAPSVTLDEVIPRYLTNLAAMGRSQHTLKSFELDLRLLRGQLGNRAVGSIDVMHLRQFIAWVRLTRENTPNSLRRKVATLKNFFGYLRDEGYLPTNTADLLPYPEAFVPLPEFLEEEATARLIEATDGNPFWHALVVLMLDTGLKRDEVLALRVADIYLADDAAGENYLIVRETDAAKRLRSRKVPVSPRLRDALRAYDPSTFPPGIPRTDGGARSGDSRVFDISIRGINFIVETCGSRAGIVTSKPRLTPQVLRESFAVAQMRARVQRERRCQEEGWRPEALQLLTLRHDAEVLELLGLKEDPDTARKYRQLVKM